jgi:hypothetical protein
MFQRIFETLGIELYILPTTYYRSGFLEFAH